LDGLLPKTGAKIGIVFYFISLVANSHADKLANGRTHEAYGGKMQVGKRPENKIQVGQFAILKEANFTQPFF